MWNRVTTIRHFHNFRPQYSIALSRYMYPVVWSRMHVGCLFSCTTLEVPCFPLHRPCRTAAEVALGNENDQPGRENGPDLLSLHSLFSTDQDG
jgi:hypothetical protein